MYTSQTAAGIAAHPERPWATIKSCEWLLDQLVRQTQQPLTTMQHHTKVKVCLLECPSSGFNLILHDDMLFLEGVACIHGF